jgi:choline dehydrogenase-like flavoprotein
MITLSDRLGAAFSKLGLAEYKPYPHIRPDTADWKDHLSDVNHHMGGTRMSADASQGVVDPHLRVWGYENLYVMSASVFPTSSHSNPTLTLLALCQRWLKEKVR